MNADCLNKYSHYTAENTADGAARAGTVRHIAKATGRVSCKSRGLSNAHSGRRCIGTNLFASVGFSLGEDETLFEGRQNCVWCFVPALRRSPPRSSYDRCSYYSYFWVFSYHSPTWTATWGGRILLPCVAK